MASSRSDGRSRADNSERRTTDSDEANLVIEEGDFDRAYPSLRTPITQIEPFVAFLRWWKQHRAHWARLYWLGHGPAGWGCANVYYQPPGDDPAIEIAHRAMGRITSGAEAVGEVVFEPVAPLEVVALGVTMEERILRRGGAFGEPGTQVGGVFRCGETLIRADRCIVKLSGPFTLDADAYRTISMLINVVTPRFSAWRPPGWADEGRTPR